MSMNLKPAIRYQLREYLISCLVFWAINALLIGIGFLVLSLNLGSGDRSGYTYNGYGFACAIFFLVFGLILPRQAIRLCVQMGVSRRTTFLSLFLSACLGLGTWWPGLLLCLAWFFLLLFLLTHFDRDWYEDVLRTAELAQSAIVAKKEGTMESVPGKVRIGATGLKKGWGASAFYYKHKIENRRGSWMLLPPASLIFAVVLIGFSFFMRESGILPVVAFAVYLQLFTAGQSRINRELYKPFIYLVPESSFSKLLHCLRELVPSALAEAIVVFVPVGLILGMGPGAILVCLFARMSYALLFQSGNLLLERFWSGASKALIMFLYFLILILLTLPGILIAVFLMVLLNLPGGVSGGLLVAGIINIPVALLLLYLLRVMLQYAEYNR